MIPPPSLRSSHARRRAWLDTAYELFFRRARETLPHASVPQNTLGRIGADQRHPSLCLGHLIGQLLIAPGRLLLPQGDDLLDHRQRGLLGVPRRPVGALLETSVAVAQEAGLPLREGAAADVRHLAGPRRVTRRLPGLAQEPLLGRRGKRDRRPCHRRPVLSAMVADAFFYPCDEHGTPSHPVQPVSAPY